MCTVPMQFNANAHKQNANAHKQNAYAYYYKLS